MAMAAHVKSSEKSGGDNQKLCAHHPRNASAERERRIV